MQKKGFTLVETIITVVIMSILIGIVFEIFIVISHIAVYTQYQKNIHNEMVYVVQTVQNLVDNQNMVLTGTVPGEPSIVASKGFEDTLQLADSTNTYNIYKQCDGGANNPCHLEMVSTVIGALPGESEVYYTLTNTSLVHVTSFYVKKLPFEAEDSFENKIHDGFWLFLSVEIPDYNPSYWRFKVNYDLQTFFTIRKY